MRLVEIICSSVPPDFSLKTQQIPPKYGNLLKEAKILLILLLNWFNIKTDSGVTRF